MLQPRQILGRCHTQHQVLQEVTDMVSWISTAYTRRWFTDQIDTASLETCSSNAMKESFLQTKRGKNIVRTLFGSIPAMQQFDVTPDLEDVKAKDVNETRPITPDVTITPTSQAPSTTPNVNIFAMEQMPRPTAPAPVTPPPVQQPQPAGIAALPADRGQTYAGLFPNDPSGQMIAQRGRQNA